MRILRYGWTQVKTRRSVWRFTLRPRTASSRLEALDVRVVHHRGLNGTGRRPGPVLDGAALRAVGTSAVVASAP